MKHRRQVPSFASDVTGPIGELNTTPLIDVMLVLLIMFIVTIPMSSHEVPLDLPQGRPPSQPFEPVRHQLQIDAGGRLSLDGAPIAAAELPARLRAVAAEQDSELLLSADGPVLVDRARGPALGMVAGVLSTTSFVPQVKKAWQEGTESVSKRMYVVTVAAFVLWTTYGFLLGSLPLILFNVLSLCLSGAILFLKIRSERRCEGEAQHGGGGEAGMDAEPAHRRPHEGGGEHAGHGRHGELRPDPPADGHRHREEDGQQRVVGADASAARQRRRLLRERRLVVGPPPLGRQLVGDVEVEVLGQARR